MAKKKKTAGRSRKETVKVTTKDIARALEGISEWALAVRRVILSSACYRDCVTEITVIRPVAESPIFIDDGCPPPE
jgi:hypothetical protein